MYACSKPPSGHHTDYTMPVPEARDFLPHLKCTTYLPALLDPEREQSFETSGITLPTKQCSHPIRPESSPVFVIYS